MFKKYWLASYLFFIGIMFLVLSCKKDDAKEMTAEEKVLFDSLKIIAFKDIRTKTDSICNGVKDSLFNTYVDSLLTLRMAEIQQLFDETESK